MRYLIVLGMLIATPATAQDIGDGWGGAYFGIDIGAQGEKVGRETTEVRSAVDANFTYTTRPTNQTLRFKRNAPHEITSTIKSGYLFDIGRFVAGAELRGSLGGIDHAWTQPTTVSTPTANSPLYGGITTQADTVSSRLQVEGGGAFVVRAGLPIGKRVLISAFGGPAIVAARLRAQQETTVNSFRVYLPCVPSPTVSCHFAFSNYSFGSSARGGDRDTMFGGTVGGATDLKLTRQIALHVEASLTRTAPIRVTIAGTGTTVSHRPQLYNAMGGIVFRF